MLLFQLIPLCQPVNLDPKERLGNKARKGSRVILVSLCLPGHQEMMAFKEPRDYRDYKDYKDYKDPPENKDLKVEKVL
jgi:hypothetical protein